MATTPIADEIVRIREARNIIRNKLVNFGLSESTDLITALASAVDSITNQGAISAEVKEGETYTIPQGYHNGSGTVSGVAGGGNYKLQSKGPITPTKSSQSITPDAGFYGLSDVTVSAIPAAYQDVTSVTATASDVLATKIIVNSIGQQVTGLMPNNGAISQALSTSVTSYTVPSGYHNGSGVVSISLETKSATPSTVAQDVVPSNGKVLSKVTVNAIPSNFADVRDDTALASHVLSGEKAHSYNHQTDSAVAITGTMPNNGAISQTLDTATTSYTIPSGYHNGSGTVSIVTQIKSATPSTASQDIAPASGKVLSKVTVEAIPKNYANTYGDTAFASGLLSGLIAHSYRNDIDEAYKITGTMPNNGAISSTLSATSTIYTVPSGYHNGSGTVSIVLETKSATPSTVSQDITPTSGKVLSKVTVNAIPSQYKDTTNADAVASNVLTGKKFVNSTGTVTGTMANNGAIAGTIDGLTTMSYTVPSGYHNGSGTVSLTSDIETALASI